MSQSQQLKVQRRMSIIKLKEIELESLAATIFKRQFSRRISTSESKIINKVGGGN